MPLPCRRAETVEVILEKQCNRGRFQRDRTLGLRVRLHPFHPSPPQKTKHERRKVGEGVAAVHMVRPFQDTSHVADGWKHCVKHTMDSCYPTSFARQRIRTDCSSTWNSLLKPCTTAATGGRGRYKNPCRRTRKTNRERLLRFFFGNAAEVLARQRIRAD